jgi:adenylate cyclase
VPGDGPEERLRKGTLTLAATVTAALGLGWGLTYWLLGLRLAAVFPIGYMAVTVVSLAFFFRTKRYRVFRFVQLLLMLLLPSLLQWSLGGFVASSAVILWALMAPLGALMYHGIRAAGGWLTAYLGAVSLSGVLEAVVPSAAGRVPEAVIVAFFLLNVAGVAATSFFLLRYFVMERDRAQRELQAERAKSERLLLNVLPEPIAARLKETDGIIAEGFDEATVLFADIAGFTAIAGRVPPTRVVAMLDQIFTLFDRLADEQGLEKIKTIGDAYMVAGGIPVPRTDHTEAVAEMALAMREAVAGLLAATGEPLALRIGMDTGPIVAGVIGRRKFIYDLWGDAVNTASRMESHGVPGQIHVTDRVERRLRDRYDFRPRGVVDVKGKGPMTTYLLVARRRSPLAASGS